MSNTDFIKKTVAQSFIDNFPLRGLVGLGSGTTVEALVLELGEVARKNPNKLSDCKFISASNAISSLARSLHLNHLDEEQIRNLKCGYVDLYVDSMDQVDEKGNMLKGKGGALTREKILCSYSLERVFLCNNSKFCQKLSDSLSVEFIPLAFSFLQNTIAHSLQLKAILRTTLEQAPYITDNGNWIMDVYSSSTPLEHLSEIIAALPGIVEVGFFKPHPYSLIVGYPDQKIDIIHFE